MLSDHSLSFCNLSKSPFSYMEYNRLKNASGDLHSDLLLSLFVFKVILNESRNHLVLTKNFSSPLCFPLVFPHCVSWLRDITITDSHHAHLPICPVLCHLAVGYQSIIINVLWKLSMLDMQFRWKSHFGGLILERGNESSTSWILNERKCMYVWERCLALAGDFSCNLYLTSAF